MDHDLNSNLINYIILIRISSRHLLIYIIRTIHIIVYINYIDIYSRSIHRSVMLIDIITLMIQQLSINNKK